ncbi:MAG: hypothetical protein INQ03_07940 [Candidatus Heimdallarchaeota archaeon]|nr:hypothetical protein [Candidatus Heimdallarchaeota archaeon]
MKWYAIFILLILIPLPATAQDTIAIGNHYSYSLDYTLMRSTLNNEGYLQQIVEHDDRELGVTVTEIDSFRRMLYFEQINPFNGVPETAFINFRANDKGNLFTAVSINLEPDGDNYYYASKITYFYPVLMSIYRYGLNSLSQISWYVEPDFEVITNDALSQLNVAYDFPTEYGVDTVFFSDILYQIDDWSINGVSQVYTLRDIQPSRVWDIRYDLSNNIYTYDFENGELIAYNRYLIQIYVEYNEDGTLEEIYLLMDQELTTSDGVNLEKFEFYLHQSTNIVMNVRRWPLAGQIAIIAGPSLVLIAGGFFTYRVLKARKLQKLIERSSIAEEIIEVADEAPLD